MFRLSRWRPPFHIEYINVGKHIVVRLNDILSTSEPPFITHLSDFLDILGTILHGRQPFMCLFSLPASVFLTLFPLLPAKAQTNNSTGDTFLGEYISFLNDSGYTSLSNVLLQANSTPYGQQWISQLSEGNWTVFAPTNEASASSLCCC
mgnify:CR=1 FL=1